MVKVRNLEDAKRYQELGIDTTDMEPDAPQMKSGEYRSLMSQWCMKQGGQGEPLNSVRFGIHDIDKTFVDGESDDVIRWVTEAKERKALRLVEEKSGNGQESPAQTRIRKQLDKWLRDGSKVDKAAEYEYLGYDVVRFHGEVINEKVVPTRIEVNGFPVTESEYKQYLLGNYEPPEQSKEK